jgi:hypothetical protein
MVFYHLWSASMWRKVVSAGMAGIIAFSIFMYAGPFKIPFLSNRVVRNALAASVGPRTATASGDCVSTTGIGSVAWTSPGNAFSENASNATAGLGRNVTSNWLKCTNFGFTTGMIATGSIINGFVVTVKRSVSSSNSTTTDAGIRLVKGGTIDTTDRSTTTAWPTSLTSEDHGASNDLWGNTWTVSDVTASNFGAAVAAAHGSTTNSTLTFSVDVITITISYTPPPWTTITQRAGVIQNDQNGTNLTSHTAKIGEKLIAKIQVDTDSGSSNVGMNFQLQYDKNDSSWQNVKQLGEIRPAKSSVFGRKKITGTGDAGSCTGGTAIKQSYFFEQTGTSGGLTIAPSSCYELSFVIDTVNASANTTYRFRLYDKSTASALDAYSAYPSFTTVTSGNNTARYSKSNTLATNSSYEDLKHLLDSQGYDNVNTDDAAREILQNVSSDTTADVTATGANTGDTFATSVANAGDVNGDGYSDLIVGASTYSSSTGRAYIYYGGTVADTTADVTLTGANTGDTFGTSVASAGDVNGDGFADVEVGAKSYSSSTGRAYIFYGGASMDTIVDVTMTGESTSNFFGSSVASAGDINADGYDDVVVGAYGYNANTGRVYIYYGGASMDATADVTMTGGGSSSDFGASASSAGDVNGDGYADVAVGSPSFGSSIGRAYIYLGGASMDTTADATMTGPATGSKFGNSISSAGDTNGDGYDDWIVGAKIASSTGRAYVYYGGASIDSVPDVSLVGGAANDEFGASVAFTGDVNGDGYGDILVGASGYNSSTGRAYIYYGGASMDTTADVTMTGGATSDLFGISVATAGDVNGDGYVDVVVGASGYSLSTGRAYIYYQSENLSSSTNRSISGPDSGNYGFAVSGVGDVNGDGFEDWMVGAYAYNSSTGRAYLYYGGTSVHSTADAVLTGETTTNYFGVWVDGAGDVNNDGYDDIIIGARAYSSSTGRAYIFYGSANGLRGSIAASSANVIMTGEAATSYFGRAVAGVGDVNGDGFDDVAVGAWQYASATGRVYVYYGGTLMDNTADVVMTGSGTNQALGYSVEGAGDVNQDGYDDIIASAQIYGTNAGRVYIYYGGSSMNNTEDVTYSAENNGDFFGCDVAPAGDINHDGYPDMIFGARSYSTITGRAYIFYGGPSLSSTYAASSANVIITGEGTNDGFGASVEAVGDINGDGYDDLSIGADQDNSFTGKAYIFYGRETWPSSIAASSADWSEVGASTAFDLGWMIGNLGDINGDGRPDIGFGAYEGQLVRVLLGGSATYTPTFMFANKRSAACSSASSLAATWNGQSSTAASSKNLLLQVYRFGSTNAWTTVTTESSLAADTDGNITGSVSSNLSEYCDGSNWSYWRVYQASGTQTLQTDYWNLNMDEGGGPTPTPTPANDQLLRGGRWFSNGVLQPFTF